MFKPVSSHIFREPLNNFLPGGNVGVAYKGFLIACNDLNLPAACCLKTCKTDFFFRTN